MLQALLSNTWCKLYQTLELVAQYEERFGFKRTWKVFQQGNLVYAIQAAQSYFDLAIGNN